MVVALACRKQSRRRRRKMTVQRHLSKSSLESGGTSSMTDEGSTTIIAPITATTIHPPHHANKQSSPRHVHFTVTTTRSSSLEYDNNKDTTIHPDNPHRHDQEENDDVMVDIALIPTLAELDVSALYYTRQEIRDMGNRAKAQARTAKSLARILSLQAHVRVPCFDHGYHEEDLHAHHYDNDDLHDDQTSPTTISSLWQDYESLVLLYEHDTVRQASSTAFRGLEHLMIGHDRESRKLAIQRILQVQDDTVVREQQQDAPQQQQQQRISLMRMRSLLHSRKSCHLAARVGATDALEANTT